MAGIRSVFTIFVGVSLGPAAHGQTNIDHLHKHSWQENCGFMDWYGTGSEGVVVGLSFLSGFIWCENIGWINVGDGTPGAPLGYVNATGADTGVNILPNGTLTGLGWAENAGWINFATGPALGPQRARYDRPARRFRGYAWGENIGFINLDDATHYVALRCYANCDGSTSTPVLTPNDFLCFMNAYAGGLSSANCDGSTGTPALTPNDFACFLDAYVAGCS